VLARTSAVAALARLDHLPALQAREIAKRRFGNEHDVAALAAVAAVRPALRDELLAAKRQTAVPATAGLDVKLGAVAERG
jgi:hypothetical protein